MPSLNRLTRSFPAWFLMFLFIFPACSEKEGKESSRADVLLEFGDSSLLRSYVVERIPIGISAADSARLFRAIVRNWVEDMLLADMASERLGNLAEIEEKVNNYRRQLIVAEYLKVVSDNGRRNADMSKVRDYFVNHGNELLLEAPAVKGIYVKVPDNAERLEDIRSWVRSGNDAAVDRLEKYGLGQALQYEYFKDRWIDWQSIAEEIPYRFSDAETFLKKNSFFETSSGGSTYFLHVSEWIPAGEKMPYEFAARRISEILAQQNAEAYRKSLVSSLYQRARKEKQLRIISYDPGMDK